MTINHCTASYADHGNPTHLTDYPIARVAEEEGEYKANKPAPTAIKLNSEALRAYLEYRRQEHGMLTTRLDMQLEDLDQMLSEQEEVDIFDLLVEHTLIGDANPARLLGDLMAVLDDDALINLECRTIARAGEFIRDLLKQDTVRWHLAHYHQGKEEEPEE